MNDDNLRRAANARSNVWNYGWHYHTEKEPLRDNIIGMLSDLMHLCDEESEDFNIGLQKARQRYMEQCK